MFGNMVTIVWVTMKLTAALAAIKSSSLAITDLSRPMTPEQKHLFDNVLPKLGKLVPCGPNNNWSVRAYFIPDGGKCERYDGTDLYIIDHEDGLMSIVSMVDDVTTHYTTVISQVTVRKILEVADDIRAKEGI